MELIDVLHQAMQESQQAAQPTDMAVGTVVSVSPLEVQTSGSMQPLLAPVLYLTAAVVEKKIPVLKHTHMGTHGETGPALLETDVICMEHGKALPVEGGYIILNRALQKGDRVLLLKVQHGQKYIILSRIFEVGGNGNNPGN